VPIKNNLDAMRLAFEIAGIAFVFRGDIASGVQFRPVDQAA
jgi:hypothetical protein